MSALPAEQTAAIYHRRVGDILVTVINDGHMTGAVEMVQGITPEQTTQALRDKFRPVPPVLTVNMFVLRHAGRTAIIDSGFGNGEGGPPGVGRMKANLAAAGIDPADVDTALLTHLHPDHSLGLIEPDGSARFPNAQVRTHQKEIDHWLNEENARRAPEAAQPFFGMARASVAPYGERLAAFSDELFPGVTAVPLPGHTPGHCGFRIDSAGETLLIWGDIFHIPEVQVRYPAASIAFDLDPAAAAATREKTLDMTASDRILVAGMHLQFPTFAHIVRDGGGYALVPEAWSPLAI